MMEGALLTHLHVGQDPLFCSAMAYTNWLNLDYTSKTRVAP